MATYAEAREALRSAELDLMLQRERVAAMRRALPPGPLVDDYVFDSADGEMSLVELFAGAERTLILYHFMYGKGFGQPCPMCSMWADGWAGIVDHLTDRVDFAVVTAAPIGETVELAGDRGWSAMRWLSAAGNTFKRDIGGEDADGNQSPFLSVYRLDDGRPRLTWSGGAHISGEHWRGIDLLSPVWHFLDLTPEGRGDFMPTPRAVAS